MHFMWQRHCINGHGNGIILCIGRLYVLFSASTLGIAKIGNAQVAKQNFQTLGIAAEFPNITFSGDAW